jgi:hypothetical protein
VVLLGFPTVDGEIVVREFYVAQKLGAKIALCAPEQFHPYPLFGIEGFKFVLKLLTT